jgi:hypothetical protein
LPESPTVLTFAPPPPPPSVCGGSNGLSGVCCPPPSVCGGGNGDGGCAVADWLTPQMGCDSGV